MEPWDGGEDAVRVVTQLMPATPVKFQDVRESDEGAALPQAGNHGGAGYPQIRLLALVACGTRTVIDRTGTEAVKDARRCHTGACRSVAPDKISILVGRADPDRRPRPSPNPLARPPTSHQRHTRRVGPCRSAPRANNNTPRYPPVLQGPGLQGFRKGFR